MTDEFEFLEPEIPERRLSDGFEQAHFESHCQPIPDFGKLDNAVGQNP
jgi:hypothetical protein